MDNCQDQNIIATIISAVIASVITIIGWFILNAQNRKIRREEAKRETYLVLSGNTRDITRKIGIFKETVKQESQYIITLLKKSRNLDKDKYEEKKDIVNQWHTRAQKILDDTTELSNDIDDYLWTLDMGGTDFGEGSKTYEALSAVIYDAGENLGKIIGIWIKYINFDNMTDLQLENLEKDTAEETEKLDELRGCLEDILILMYNKYVATQLKLKKRTIKQDKKRRYILENGLSDNRQ